MGADLAVFARIAAKVAAARDCQRGPVYAADGLPMASPASRVSAERHGVSLVCKVA